MERLENDTSLFHANISSIRAITYIVLCTSCTCMPYCKNVEKNCKEMYTETILILQLCNRCHREHCNNVAISLASDTCSCCIPF